MIISFAVYLAKIIIPVFTPIYQGYVEIFNTNLNKEDVKITLSLCFSIGVIVGFLCFFVYLLGYRNKMMLWSIFGILFLVGSGIPILDHFVGIKPLNANILDHGDNYKIIGNLECSNAQSNKFALIGEEINCKVEIPELLNKTSLITFIFKNGHTETLYFINNSFKAPQNLEYIYFLFTGNDSSSASKTFSVGLEYEFLNEVEYVSKQKDFFFSILALLAFAIFSVPSFVLTLRDILNSEH